MDKKILIGLSFSVIFLFVITGCSQGQAVKIPTANNAQLAQQKLTQKLTCQDTGCKFQCQTVSNFDFGGEMERETMDVLCQKIGYDQCVDVTYVGRTQTPFSMPGHCEQSFMNGIERAWMEAFLGVADLGDVANVDAFVNCCKIN